jgi:EAL domain-containing protein (putative c-di-GMP-specific phosphodiesterase class I)
MYESRHAVEGFFVKNDGLDTECDWHHIQETNGSFIVLNSKGVIVSCNDEAKLARLALTIQTILPFDRFWLDDESRLFQLSEFKDSIGKEARLLFMDNGVNTHKVKVWADAFWLLGKQYYSLFFQNRLVEQEHVVVLSSAKKVQALIDDLNDDLLDLHYQPQINITDNSLHGVEVLARWTNKEFGRVAPDDFIALAEEHELIADLDIWVMSRACRQLALWREQGIHIPTVAVNFSPLTFTYAHLEQKVQAILEENSLLPSDLVIEVTENKSINTSCCFDNTIARIHALGVAISLDDFGTGYSNLKRLLKFPVSQLKLDRVFVDGLSNERYSEMSQELSKVVLSLCKTMRATAIAEGVETQQQLSYLASMGYGVVQGYIFSPPLPQLEFEHWCFKRK